MGWRLIQVFFGQICINRRSPQFLDRSFSEVFSRYKTSICLLWIENLHGSSLDVKLSQIFFRKKTSRGFLSTGHLHRSWMKRKTPQDFYGKKTPAGLLAIEGNPQVFFGQKTSMDFLWIWKEDIQKSSLDRRPKDFFNRQKISIGILLKGNLHRSSMERIQRSMEMSSRDGRTPQVFFGKNCFNWSSIEKRTSTGLFWTEDFCSSSLDKSAS